MELFSGHSSSPLLVNQKAVDCKLLQLANGLGQCTQCHPLRNAFWGRFWSLPGWKKPKMPQMLSMSYELHRLLFIAIFVSAVRGFFVLHWPVSLNHTNLDMVWESLPPAQVRCQWSLRQFEVKISQAAFYIWSVLDYTRHYFPLQFIIILLLL